MNTEDQIKASIASQTELKRSDTQALHHLILGIIPKIIILAYYPSLRKTIVMNFSIAGLILTGFIFLSSNVLSQDVLYWSDVQTGKIMRANTDGSDPVALLSQNMPRFIADDTIYSRL
jgi:hypothetical protein